MCAPLRGACAWISAGATGRRMPCTACVVESAPGRESPRQGGVQGWSPWMCLLREQTLSVAPLRNKMPKRRYTAQTRYLYDKPESQPRNKPRGVAGIIIGVCGADVHLAGIGVRLERAPSKFHEAVVSTACSWRLYTPLFASSFLTVESRPTAHLSSRSPVLTHAHTARTRTRRTRTRTRTCTRRMLEPV